MKLKTLGLFFLFFMSSARLNADPTAVGPILFDGGINMQTAVTNIKDGQSPNMCNCISNLDGSMSKRFGSEKYVRQPVSSQPVAGLFRAYASSGTNYRTSTLAIIGDRIVFTTDTANREWITLSSGISPHQNWSFVQWDNTVIFTGDRLINDIMVFDVFTASLTTLFSVDTASDNVRLRAKYLTKQSNYLFFANVADVTTSTTGLTASATYYSNRIYYSFLIQPSSVGATRFEQIRTGEAISGIDSMFDRVNIFFPSSISEIDFTILNPGSSGNQTIAEVVNGFGLKASRSLQNIGQSYIFGAQDGIRIWDGGRRARLTVSEESRKIDQDIKPLIENLIKRGSYENIVGKYYKKREWYILSYEDPDKFPKGKNNSVLVYDIRLNQWYPLCGWLAQSFATFDGFQDNGDLIYGSSMDGMVHLADIEKKIDDSEKQIALDTMDSTNSWTGNNFNKDTYNVKEGTGSLRLWVDGTATRSTMSIVKIFNMGEWYDKTKITKSDKLSFQVFVTSVENITNLRVDLEVNDVKNDFDVNFTSVTLSSGSLTTQNTTWATVQIALSSFPISSNWIALDKEELPFADTLTFYGLRFVVNGVGISSVSIDNVRIVQNKENPVNFFRFTKLFDFGSVAFKTQGQILLTLDKPSDSILKMDIYNDFGKVIRTEKVDRSIPRELVVLGFNTASGVAIIDDIDFSVLRSSVMSLSVMLPSNGTADKENLYFSDRTGNRIVKLSRRDFSVIVSSFGSLGSGTTNFNVPHQIKLDEKSNIYMTDSNNNRLKIHSQNDLSVSKVYGTLGTNATSFHIPSGLTFNENFLTVADEGNKRLVKLSVSTLGFVLERLLDFNIAAEASLAEDENLVYLAYNRLSQDSVENLDFFLESRTKDNYDLVNRVKILPDGVVALSSYSAVGNIALRGRYIYIAFNDAFFYSGAKYYIQKRLKKDFSLVNEYMTNTRLWSVIGDPFPYKPSTQNVKRDLGVEGRYIQIKFYDEGIDNDVKLINQAFIISPESLKY